MQVSGHFAGILQAEDILDIETSLKPAPEIQVLADYVTFDDSLLSDHNAALADKLSFKCTVNADIVRRIDLSLYYCSC